MRIAPASTLPWYLRPFFWNQRRKYGKVLGAALLWARSPRLFLAVATLYGAIDRRSSPIEPALRSLLTVRVSQINHCRFASTSTPRLSQRGIGENQLWALDDWRASNLFSARERIALEYAEAITRSDLEVSDDLMARLKGQFNDDAILELTALIAFRTCRASSTPALDVPPQGFCRLPERIRNQAESGRSSSAHAERPDLAEVGKYDP